MQVKEIMKRPFIIEKDIKLADAADLMVKKGIGSLIFLNGGKIKGIITKEDLIKNFGSNKKVSEAMNKNVFSVAPDAELETALEIMNKNKIKKLPVMDGDKLVGIITTTDLLLNAEEIEGNFFFE